MYDGIKSLQTGAKCVMRSSRESHLTISKRTSRGRLVIFTPEKIFRNCPNQTVQVQVLTSTLRGTTIFFLVNIRFSENTAFHLPLKTGYQGPQYLLNTEYYAMGTNTRCTFANCFTLLCFLLLSFGTMP